MAARIRAEDRRAALFLTAYRALCRRHGCMVGQVADSRIDGNEYHRFAVVFLDESPEALDKALQEMLLGRPVTVEWIDPIEQTPPGRGG